MSDRTHPQKELFRRFGAALREVERRVEETLVPGELDAWCRDVQEVLAAFRPALDTHDEAEEQILRQILAADMELAPRVDRLRQESLRIREDLLGLAGRVTDLRNAARSHPDGGSEEPLERGRSLREELLGSLVRCRMHRKETETWLVEAFYRDRGVAD